MHRVPSSAWTALRETPTADSWKSFAKNASPEPLGRAYMFYKSNADYFQKILDGIAIKTLVCGEKMLVTEVHMDKGSRLPTHSHPQEQSGRLIRGKILLTIGKETSELAPGDCWNVPGDLEHGAEILEDSIAVEVFSPVREDYLKYLPK
jgi:quercetin dioxygenase-like cupin family protein